jgi:hypothetical protein
MTDHIELPADLKTQIQDEVSIQQCRFDEQTHQGIDAAIRVFARLVESWRPVPAEAGDSTLPRYFVELAGHAEPTIWIGTGPDDPTCQPIVRKCTLDGEHLILWPTLVKALTVTGNSTADETPTRVFQYLRPGFEHPSGPQYRIYPDGTVTRSAFEDGAMQVRTVDPSHVLYLERERDNGTMVETAEPAEAGDSTADLSALADACDDFLTAYRGPSDALIPDMLDLIRRALSGEDPYVVPSATGDSTADETAAPREWRKGDPEPEDRPRVKDSANDVWTYNDRNGLWYSPETAPFKWEHIARKWGPLTEVLAASSVRDTAETADDSEIFTYNSPEPNASVLRDLDSGRYLWRSGDRWADGTSQGPSGLPAETWNAVSRGRSFKVVHPAPSGDTAETECPNGGHGVAQRPGVCPACRSAASADERAAGDELARLTEEMGLYDRPAVTADETPGSPA